jgi:hypothetical protein
MASTISRKLIFVPSWKTPWIAQFSDGGDTEIPQWNKAYR